MIRRVAGRCKVKALWAVAVAKASPNRANESRDVDPKPKRSILGQVEERSNIPWRTERTAVENAGDELRIGVKG